MTLLLLHRLSCAPPSDTPVLPSPGLGCFPPTPAWPQLLAFYPVSSRFLSACETASRSFRKALRTPPHSPELLCIGDTQVLSCALGIHVTVTSFREHREPWDKTGCLVEGDRKRRGREQQGGKGCPVAGGSLARAAPGGLTSSPQPCLTSKASFQFPALPRGRGLDTMSLPCPARECFSGPVVTQSGAYF